MDLSQLEITPEKLDQIYILIGIPTPDGGRRTTNITLQNLVHLMDAVRVAQSLSSSPSDPVDEELR